MVELAISLTKVVYLTLWGYVCGFFCFFKSLTTKADFGGDICLITGAGKGLGRELAIKFAEHGATVVLWDLNEDTLKLVADKIRERGGDAHYYVCDCSKREEVHQTADKVRDEVGHVTILINNAGYGGGKPLPASGEEEIERVFDVDTLAHFWTTKAFSQWMIDNNYGHIVSIASVSGFGALFGSADYSAANAALITFTEGLRHEFITIGRDGIAVTCICPYHMDTSMFKGFKTKFPRLLPTLKPSTVADRTISAVVNKETLVIIPWFMTFVIASKWLLPLKAYDELINLIGANEAMKSAHGVRKD